MHVNYDVNLALCTSKPTSLNEHKSCVSISGKRLDWKNRSNEKKTTTSTTLFFITHQVCGSCGFKNISREGGFVIICSNDKCGKSHFPRTDPAIITLISSQDKILLGRSPRFPDGMYSTLAGFVEPGESLEQALEREVFEEVGVKVKNIEYFNSQPWPFPASLMLGFFAEAINEDMNIDYNEIEDAHWFSIEELKTLQHPSISGGFKLPRIDSIARRLVDTWINKFN